MVQSVAVNNIEGVNAVKIGYPIVVVSPCTLIMMKTIDYVIHPYIENLQ